MSDTQETVLVQPKAPEVVPLESEMDRSAWASYCRAIWEARLRSHLHARYFSRLRRIMGFMSVLLQLVVVVGSGSAFASLVGSFWGVDVTTVLTAVVASTAVVLQISGLVGKVQKAAILEEAWAVRCRFWDDAIVMVQDSKYLGPLSELQAPEAALRRVEAQLGVPEIRWFVARVQRELIRVDPFARAGA